MSSPPNQIEKLSCLEGLLCSKEESGPLFSCEYFKSNEVIIDINRENVKQFLSFLIHKQNQNNKVQIYVWMSVCN